MNEFAASDAQRRLWFIEACAERQGAYAVALAWRVAGPLDAGHLRACLRVLSQRHEALRTSFVERDGDLFQRIADDGEVPLALVDAGTTAPGALAALEMARPFDLARGPLLRASLVTAGPERVFVLCAHHLVVDGWSMGILLRELAALHDDLRAPLPPLRLQYADYAVWQRESARSPELLRQGLAFWSERLRGAPDVANLPVDRPRAVPLADDGDSVPLAFDAELCEALRELGRSRRASTFMVLAAALAVLLEGHGGDGDHAIGYPVANRTQPELEGVVGLFVNTAVLRVRLSLQDRFIDLLDRVREDVICAQPYEDVPFDRVVEDLRPARREDRTPLFQVMLALNNTGAERLRLGQAVLTPLEQGCGAAKFDLTLDLTEGAGRIFGALEFRSALFDRGTVQRMGHDLQRLLVAAAGRPASPLRDLVALRDDGADGPRRRAAAAAVAVEPGDALRPAGADVAARLAMLWRAVLGVESVVDTDNFFDAGGSSLLVSRLAAAIKKEFGISLPIRTLYRSHDFGHLAGLVESVGQASRAAEAEPIR